MKMVKTPFETIFFLLMTLSLFLGCKADKSFEPQNDSEVGSTSWNLVFEDEFNDLDSWNAWQSGAFNNEIQLYREEQLSITNGILKINALRENAIGPSTPYDTSTKNFEYVSGRIESKQTFGPSDKDGEREYRFMARIKLPFGHGMWPAFWSYGDPWPTQGEIDILEARGGETDRFISNIFYGPTEGQNINHDTEAKHLIGKNLTEDFHVYEMIWRKDSIEIFFDNELIHTYRANTNNNISNLYGKKHKIVFNTAVGGWFFQNQNSSNYADSSTMEVDWVRIYKK